MRIAHGANPVPNRIGTSQQWHPALKAWFCVEGADLLDHGKMCQEGLGVGRGRLALRPGFVAIRQEAAVPVQIGLFRAPGIVAQADDLAHPLQPCCIVHECLRCGRAVRPCLGSAVLIAVDAYRVRCLLKLPRLSAHTPAHLGQKQIQRLLEAVSGMGPGEEQELPHPAHEVRLVLNQRQVLLLKELGIAVEHLVQMITAIRHIWVSCLSRSG